MRRGDGPARVSFGVAVRLPMVAVALIVGILDLLAGCAFDISHVERVPTTFQPAVADGSGWTLPHEQSIGVGSGFATTLRRDTRWHLVGHIPQGDVYETSDQIVTVEASGRRYNPRSS